MADTVIDLLVKVTPNKADPLQRLTVRRDKHDGEHLGWLPAGFVARAVKSRVIGTVTHYQIVVHQTPWPAEWRDEANTTTVWANAAYLPEYNPAPVPDPTPAPGDGSLKSLAAKIGQALLDWSEE